MLCLHARNHKFPSPHVRVPLDFMSFVQFGDPLRWRRASWSRFNACLNRIQTILISEGLRQKLDGTRLMAFTLMGISPWAVTK